jgi:outer membrane protein
MKKLLIITVCLFGFTWANAQKFGYVDSEYIMSKIPDYGKAQKEIDDLSAKWQKEIDEKYKEIDKLYKQYQSEEVLLTEAMKKQRQDTIIAREKRVKDYQKKIFGFEGLMFLKKQELVKPIQDKVFEAIEKVAKKKGLQMIFDKSGDLVVVYSDGKHDYSDYVLEELGIVEKVQTNLDNPDSKPGAAKPTQQTSQPATPTRK